MSYIDKVQKLFVQKYSVPNILKNNILYSCLKKGSTFIISLMFISVIVSTIGVLFYIFWSPSVEPILDINPIIGAVIAIIGVFVSLVIHELSHAVAILAYGGEINNIKIYSLFGLPLLGAAIPAEMPTEHNAKAVIASAGVVSNHMIGLILLPFALITMNPILIIFSSENIVIGLFNSLPLHIYAPLDGYEFIMNFSELISFPINSAFIGLAQGGVIYLLLENIITDTKILLLFSLCVGFYFASITFFKWYTRDLAEIEETLN